MPTRLFMQTCRANAEFGFTNSLRGHLGITWQDVSVTDKSTGKKIRNRQLLTERLSSTWSLSYSFAKTNWVLDYTGALYGKMLLPLLSAADPRLPQSPVWSIQNIQLTKKFKNGFEVYGGIKNFLNFTPVKGNPFIIARTQDPFDKQVQFNSNGQVVATPQNPYALTFDPNYVYAPNQGRRLFLGLRVTVK
jgi:outer membrane receptor for ferrienterochelin and colicins